MNEKQYYLNQSLIRRFEKKKINKINLKKHPINSKILDRSIENLSNEKKKLNKNKINSFSYTNYNNNKYWHLMSGNCHVNLPEMDWIKHLRYHHNINLKLKGNISPPSFYNDDLKNFMKKMKMKSYSTKNINNFKDLSYLTKNNINGKPNIHQLNYFANLREVKVKKNSSFINPNKWKNTNFLSSRDLYSYLPVQKSLDENLIIRPYYNKFTRESFNDEKNKIIKKNLIKDKILAMNYLGEHKSELPYTERYKDNLNLIIKGYSNNINIYNYLFNLRVYDPIKIQKKNT